MNAQAQQLPTSGAVNSRLGKLEIENGYPTDGTAQKLYADIDFQRACQAYLWALPLMGAAQWAHEHREKFGAGQGVFRHSEALRSDRNRPRHELAARRHGKAQVSEGTGGVKHD